MSNFNPSSDDSDVYSSILAYVDNHPRNLTYVGIGTVPTAWSSSSSNDEEKAGTSPVATASVFDKMDTNDHLIPSFILDIYTKTSKTIRIVHIDPRFCTESSSFHRYLTSHQQMKKPLAFLPFQQDSSLTTGNDKQYDIWRSNDDRIEILTVPEYLYYTAPNAASSCTLPSHRWILQRFIDSTVRNSTSTGSTNNSSTTSTTDNQDEDTNVLIVHDYANPNDDELVDTYKCLYNNHPRPDLLRHRVYFDNRCGQVDKECPTETFYSLLDSIKSMDTTTTLSTSSSSSSSSSSASTSSLSIQYVSDIHLELMQAQDLDDFCSLFQPLAPILILAGDIGNPYSASYRSFIEWVAVQYRIVFLIAGNHEFYRNEIGPGKSKIREVTKSFLNVIYLDNSYFDYRNVRFIGSIQWSRVKNPAYTINDTRVIRNFTPHDYDNLHTVAKDYLDRTITESSLPVIVITHHVPLYELTHPKYRIPMYEKYNQWFSADMDDIVLKNTNKIKGWIYGHTHTSSIINKYNVNFYCNPLGYIGENEWTNENVNQVCIIPTGEE